MQAIVFDQFGEPEEVLSVRNVDEPIPGPGDVVVRMLTSPINPSDLMTVRGIYGKSPALPAIPGYEGVGIVESSGGGLLGKFLKGKRVAVLNRETGNWCEKTVVPAKQAIPLPASLPLEQAAMFFVNPAAAYIMTRKVLKVPAGEWLLQTAAGSALGKMVIQLGRRFGFRTLNVVRRAEQIEELNGLGADAVVHFDSGTHSQNDLREMVLELTENQGVRYAIDPVGGEVASAVANCIGKSGRMLLFGSLTTNPMALSPRHWIANGASLSGFWLTNYMDGLGLIGKIRLVREIASLHKAGILSSEVGERFRLENISDAVRQAEVTGRRGKVLLDISAP
ncbi:MAG: zinc-dependent alcohol dehydrogenase family protein [Planctomycetaceae bacterium]